MNLAKYLDEKCRVKAIENYNIDTKMECYSGVTMLHFSAIFNAR